MKGNRSIPWRTQVLLSMKQSCAVSRLITVRTIVSLFCRFTINHNIAQDIAPLRNSLHLPMSHISTPEHESSGLVNSMEGALVFSDIIEQNINNARKASWTEIRYSMQKESDAQKYFVQIMYDVLNDSVAYNDSLQVATNNSHCMLKLKIKLILFSRQEKRGISIFDGEPVSFKASYYTMRMVKYSGASPCCFIVALMYICRFRIRRPAVVLSSTTIQRLLLVAVMTASKYLEDITIDNARWCHSSLSQQIQMLWTFLSFCLAFVPKS